MAKKKNDARLQMQETAQIDKAYRELSGEKKKKSNKKKKKQRKSLLAVVFVLVLILALCVGVLVFLEKGVSNPLPELSILPTEPTIGYGVTVAGVDVGGMTREEAEAAVAAGVGDSYYTESMVVTILDQQLELTPAVTGAKLDVAGAVAEAMTCGTDANPKREVDALPYLNLNETAIRTRVDEFKAQFPTEAQPTMWDVTGEESEESLVITLGKESYQYDSESMYDLILDAYAANTLSLTLPCEVIQPETVDLDTIFSEYCSFPIDAQMNKETFEVEPHTDGYQFDLDLAKEMLAGALPGDTLQIPFTVIPADVTTQELEELLFRDVLAKYTAKSGSIANRNTNLKLACQALNGIVINPGETFDYNKALGQRTKEKGYKPANAYVNGETVQSYGGGICQPSSCLYYCALMADLEIVTRVCHQYVSSYVPYGMDATVSWGGPDFRFKNNTDYPIRIEATASGGNTTLKLIGTDTKDYYVKMDYEVLSKTAWKTKYEEVTKDSGHKDGAVKTTPYTGYTVQTYKLKYSKETDELISKEKEAYSKYDKRDQVIYKVVSSTEATEAPTEAPTTKPTEAPTTKPTEAPTTKPTTEPTTAPTTEPTTAPTTAPTEAPTTQPTEGNSDVGETGGDVELPDE